MFPSSLGIHHSGESAVHGFGIHEVVIPAHQRHIGTFYGSEIPEYAIDK